MRFWIPALLMLAGAPLGASEPAERGWTYQVRFSDDLSSATVRMTFRGFQPRRLVLMRNDALRALRFAPRADGRPPYRSNAARDGVLPTLQGDADVLDYTVDFLALGRVTAKQNQAQRVGRDLVTRAGLFLLHPATWPADARVQVILKLPAGIQAAVPWVRDLVASNQQGASVYELPAHAMASHARIAFGRFTPQHVPLAGGDVVYYVLDAPHRATDAGIRAWLTTAMGAMTELYGRPPAPRTHVILQPMVPGRGRPIVFGRASLAGGPLVHVMLSGTTTDAAMPGEWLTIHEMLHLGMPITTLADRWLGEGWVSYYQEVVRARAGIISAQDAWQNLHNWMQRGRASGGKRALVEESRLMTDRYAYHRVYWGGAALALKMDLRIRQATDGQRSLDDVVRYFLDHHVTPGQAIDGMALMRHADAFLRANICVPLAQEALTSRVFPDLKQVYADLGLSVVAGHVTLLPHAPHAGHRDAIMNRGGR